jgi:hypothetical protein
MVEKNESDAGQSLGRHRDKVLIELGVSQPQD